MGRAIIAAALLCASAHAANGPTFSVDYTLVDTDIGQTVSVFSDSVRWDTNARSFAISPANSSPTAAEFEGSFVFAAMPGYAITGYTIDYALTFTTTADVSTGLGDPFLGPAGTPIFSTGSRFSTSTGPDEIFNGPDSFTRVVMHQVNGLFPETIQGQLRVRQMPEYCDMFLPSGACHKFVSLPVALTLDSITITPVVVSVPEPETFALMLGGLALLWRRRHCSLAPMSIDPATREVPKKSCHTGTLMPTFLV